MGLLGRLETGGLPLPGLLVRKVVDKDGNV